MALCLLIVHALNRRIPPSSGHPEGGRALPQHDYTTQSRANDLRHRWGRQPHPDRYVLERWTIPPFPAGRGVHTLDGLSKRDRDGGVDLRCHDGQTEFAQDTYSERFIRLEQSLALLLCS